MPELLVRADPERILITALKGAHHLHGVPVTSELPGSIDDDKPGAWPWVTIRRTGGAVVGQCLGDTGSSHELATVTVDVWGSGRATKDTSQFLDPCTGQPFRSTRAEAQHVAQIIAALIETSAGTQAATGQIVLGRILEPPRWQPDPVNDRSRWRLVAQVRIRSLGRCVPDCKPITQAPRRA